MIYKVFKKLLGNGRAWWGANNFTNKILEIFISPADDLYKSLKELVYVHKPTHNLDLYNINCGEQLFEIKNKPSAIEARALNVERQWQLLNGGQGYKYIEIQLLKAGYDVKVRENIPYFYTRLREICHGSSCYGNSLYSQSYTEDILNINTNSVIQYGQSQYGQFVNGKKAQYGQNSYFAIGNGNINNGGIYMDPLQIDKGKKCFFVEVLSPLSSADFTHLSEIITQIKPAETIALVVLDFAPRKVVTRFTSLPLV